MTDYMENMAWDEIQLARAKGMLTEAQIIREGWKLWDAQQISARQILATAMQRMPLLATDCRRIERTKNVRWRDGKAYIDWGKQYTERWKALHNA